MNCNPFLLSLTFFAVAVSCASLALVLPYRFPTGEHHAVAPIHGLKGRFQ